MADEAPLEHTRVKRERGERDLEPLRLLDLQAPFATALGHQMEFEALIMERRGPFS